MKKDKIIDDCRTTPLFWDCECKEDFIQPRNTIKCAVCGAEQENQPDSRVNEVRDILKKDHLTGWSDARIDELLITATSQPRDFEELAEELKSNYTCPYCNKTITYARFTDYGKITFPYGEESGGDVEFPERIFACPECNKELDYSKLQKAGVLL